MAHAAKKIGAKAPQEKNHKRYFKIDAAKELRVFLERVLPPGKTDKAIYLANALLIADDIQEFLMRALPPGNTKHVEYLTNAILKAGARYDRLTEKQDEWFQYAPRKKRLKKLEKLFDELGCVLSEVDILSRDELASRAHPMEIETLVGSLSRFSMATKEMINEMQSDGRPRDLAEERWILRLGDMYENFFCQLIDDDRAKFFRFLMTSRPTLFIQNGKLDRRRIERALEDRKKRN